MNCSTPGLPVHHQLSEFTQTQVHWVGDAIQPSHPLLSPSPPALNPSQHQGLCQWVSSLHEVAKVLEFQLQHQSFQWTPRTNIFLIRRSLDFLLGFPGSSDSKESSWNARGLSLIPASGRSPGEGNGYPLQYSCLENSMNRGVWSVIYVTMGSQRVRHDWVIRSLKNATLCLS